jgi:plasmid maintenance system killer protein
VRFKFSDKKLEALYKSGEGREKYPKEIADIFVRRVRAIEGVAGNEKPSFRET